MTGHKNINRYTSAADVAWLLPLCFAVRVLYAFSLESLPALPPSDGYIDIAKNIATGNGFGPSEFRHLFLRTPGYPLFLSLFVNISNTSVPYPEIILAQITISTVSCGVLYGLASYCLGARVARIAAVLFALSPSSIIFCTLIFPETLQILWIITAAVLVATMFRRATVWNAVAFGSVWGIAGLTRPEATYLLPVMLIPLLIGWRKQWEFPFKLIVAVGIGKGAVMLPWIIRNASVYGAFVMHVPVTGNMLHIATYPHPPMYGRFWYQSDGEFRNLTTTREYQDVVRPYWTKTASPNHDPRRWNEIVVDTERALLDVDRRLADRAKYNITNYPAAQLRNLAFHFYDLWKRPAGWGYTPLIEIKWIWFLGYVVFLLIATAGAVYLSVINGSQSVVGSWLAFVLAHTALLLLMYTEPRYQVSSVPFLSIFAAAFITFLSSRYVPAICGKE